MVAVVSELRISLVAVPAFRRVEPVRISGPTAAPMVTSASGRPACPGLHVTKTVRAPSRRASSRPPRTKGVTPHAAMPTSTSSGLKPRSWSAAAPSAGWSSAPSIAVTSASRPPAMMPCTCSGSVPKVGGHSEASSTPSRPLVPAPM